MSTSSEGPESHLDLLSEEEKPERAQGSGCGGDGAGPRGAGVRGTGPGPGERV